MTPVVVAGGRSPGAELVGLAALGAFGAWAALSFRSRNNPASALGLAAWYGAALLVGTLLLVAAVRIAR